MTVTIPFLSFFKKVKDQATARKERSVAAPKPLPPLEKPSSERFSKTVMPNATVRGAEGAGAAALSLVI